MKINLKEEFRIFGWITIILALVFPPIFLDKFMGYIFGNLYMGLILGILISVIIDKGLGVDLEECIWTIEIEELNISIPITLFTIAVFIVKTLIIH